MQRFLDELRTDLKKLDSTHMRRSLMALPSSRPVVGLRGRKMVNLASNDYLGLSYHPRLKKVAIDAITHSGTGAGASRLITGNLNIHESTENKFAHFKHM